MPSRDDWIVIGLILGAVAVLGVTVWVLKKKVSPQRIRLRKVSEDKIAYQNLEEHEIFEPSPGRIVVRIKRKVVRSG